MRRMGGGLLKPRQDIQVERWVGLALGSLSNMLLAYIIVILECRH